MLCLHKQFSFAYLLCLENPVLTFLGRLRDMLGYND